MKKKLTISTALTLIILTAALTVSVTMMLAMRYFNRQVHSVSQLKSMYSQIDDVDQIVRKYYNKINEESLHQGITDGYVRGLGDPYADYFTPQEYVNEQQRLSGYATNVGVSVCKDVDGSMVIYYVATDSAAQKAGVLAGDILKAIDGTEIGERTVSDVQNTLNNAQKVLLSVQRDNTTIAFELSSYRYAVRSVRSRKIGEIGYVQVTGFYENTPDQFKAILSSYKEEGVTGLILDLRNNKGGLSASMQEMLSYMLPLGVYGTVSDTAGTVTNLSSSVNNQLGMSTVILVNGVTAGEAEFFAGVLQEFSLATLVGETTAGKAKCQDYFLIEHDNSAVKLTIGEYGMLKSGSYEGKGIVPSQEVTLSDAQWAIFPLLTSATDPQVKAAIAQINIGESNPMNSMTTTTGILVTTTTQTADSTTTTTVKK